MENPRMNTVLTLSHILCSVSRWAKSCPEYVTLSAKSAPARDTSNGTYIHLAIGSMTKAHPISVGKRWVSRIPLSYEQERNGQSNLRASKLEARYFNWFCSLPAPKGGGDEKARPSLAGTGLGCTIPVVTIQGFRSSTAMAGGGS